MALLDQACAKCAANQPLGVLGVIQRDGGIRRVDFPSDDIEGSLQIAQYQIRSEAGVRFYALVFPYDLQEEENLKKGLMVATEREGLLSSLFVFFAFAQPSSGSAVSVIDPRACHHTDKPLLRMSPEYLASLPRKLWYPPSRPMSGEPNQEEEINTRFTVPLSYYMMPIEDMPPDEQEGARESREIGLPLLKRAKEARLKKTNEETARKATQQ